MRVLKPLTLARRRQLCGTPVPRDSAPLPAETAELFELREERRAFADQDAAPRAHPPAAE